MSDLTPEQLAGAQNATNFLSGLVSESGGGNRCKYSSVNGGVANPTYDIACYLLCTHQCASPSWVLCHVKIMLFVAVLNSHHSVYLFSL